MHREKIIMSNTGTIPASLSTALPSPSLDGVLRTPFYFESRQQWLFAWLHHPVHTLHPDRAIMICPPIGHEQIHAHRSLRHLADALAAAGFPVLRFDYQGTGDSSGCDTDGERVTTWLTNVADARRWLIEQLGCTRISSVGLRLGATLAGLTSAEKPFENLILWAPVVKGRSYSRELKSLSRASAGNAHTSATLPGEIEAAGFVLSDQTLRDLTNLDLLQVHPWCRRALILARDDTPVETRLLEHLKCLGIETHRSVLPGYADMMVDPLTSRIPWKVITHIVDWLVACTEVTEQFHQAVSNWEGTSPAPISRASPVGDASLTQPRIHERVLRISQEPNLFGIVSRDTEVNSEQLPHIVMLNTGSIYRIGPHRLYVSLSRKLAAKGFPCVRMDLCGLGDSVTPNKERENDPYPATAFRDIDRTLQFLQTQFGVRRVVLLGLCSGAYAAFQAAAQLSSPLLIESVLINPVTFHWNEGMSLAWNRSPAVRIQSMRAHFAGVWQPRKWWMLLSGRSTLGIRGAVDMLVERWKLKKLAFPKAFSGNTTVCESLPSHPLQQDLPGDLQRIVELGRHLSCFFASSDPGFDSLMFYARRKVEEMRRAGRMDVHFIPGGDHTFSRRVPRATLLEAITEHLCRRYLQPKDGSNSSTVAATKPSAVMVGTFRRD